MKEILMKLTSRKLWVAIFAAALCVVTACIGEELTPEMVDMIKTAVSAAVAYIFGESAVDIFRQIAESMKKNNTETEDTTDTIVGED
jgi:hypothetical protein